MIKVSLLIALAAAVTQAAEPGLPTTTTRRELKHPKEHKDMKKGKKKGKKGQCEDGGKKGKKHAVIHVNQDECFRPLSNCEHFEDLAFEGQGTRCVGPVSSEYPCDIFGNGTYAYNSLLEGFVLSAPAPENTTGIPDNLMVALREMSPALDNGAIGSLIVQANIQVEFTAKVKHASFKVTCPFDFVSPVDGRRIGPCTNTTVTVYNYHGYELASAELPDLYPGDVASVGVEARMPISMIAFSEPDVEVLARDDSEYLTELCFE